MKCMGSLLKVLPLPAGDLANSTFNISLSGKIRLEGRKSTSPVVVGDHIEYKSTSSGKVITGILPRKNFIHRKSLNLSKQTHILAANIDQAILMVTLKKPITSSGFIDRFLISSEAQSVSVTLFFNKTDLLSEKERTALNDKMRLYSSLGYPCYAFSALEKDQCRKMQGVLLGKINLISGHSGTGKSTFVNQVQDKFKLRSGPISEIHEKGKHTTTFSEMIPLELGGYIIDSPGIKEMGLVEIEKEKLPYCFPEFRERMLHCRFNNCMHLEEPDCAVKEALGTEINSERYNSYLSMLNSEEALKKPWTK